MLDLLLFIVTAVLLCSWLVYPLFVGLRARFTPSCPCYDDAFVPEVTLVLCVSNAAAAIRKKLENVLALDYPAERLKIWVVSAGSSDETDSIVSSFARSGVLLLAQDGPADEALALNRLMVEVTSEIVVFSDAVSLLEPQALRRLVRNFADPRVGLVTGAPASGDGKGELSAAERGEELWSRWNVRLREWESRCGSVVEFDGALWGLRRFLYDPLKTGERNAIVTPLAVVACGFRGVQESAARYVVPVARNSAQLFQNAARQARDCLDGLLYVGRVANPLRTGGFALRFLRRQVIGWLDAFLIPAHFLLLLFADRSSPFGPLFCAFLGFYLLWALGAFCGCWRWGASPCALLNYPFYAGLRRVAALKGVLFRNYCPSSFCTGFRRRGWCMMVRAVLLAAAVLRLVIWLGMGHCLLH
ncbi:MAG: glycosyltransferase, partial [Deltaproteobacteria bacterium]|nr:glycosyltransferase [Deltaproteobacteria bacterium]